MHGETVKCTINLFSMYLNEKKNIYEILQKLHFKITNYKLLIILVPGGRRQCFVCDSGRRGKEG